MRHGFVILSDEWPLVHVRFPRNATDKEIDSFCNDMLPIYERGARGAPFVSIVDMRAMDVTGAASTQRGRLGGKLDAMLERFPGAKLGEAIIVKDELMRLFVTVASMMRRDKGASRKVFDDMERARAWALALLAER